MWNDLWFRYDYQYQSQSSNISYDYFLGIADTDKYYYTNLTDALEASDLTLQANPSFKTGAVR